MPEASDSVPGLAEASMLLTLLVWLAAVACVLGLVALGWYFTCRPGSKSPYTGQPLVHGDALTFPAIQALLQYLRQQPQPENPDFDPARAALCRDTGRVFPNVLNAWGVVKLPRTVHALRYCGELTQWDQLLPPERDKVLAAQPQLERFEMDDLRADLETLTVVGWQRVPETELQVLVVQPPASI